MRSHHRFPKEFLHWIHKTSTTQEMNITLKNHMYTIQGLDINGCMVIVTNKNVLHTVDLC